MQVNYPCTKPTIIYNVNNDIDREWEELNENIESDQVSQLIMKLGDINRMCNEFFNSTWMEIYKAMV